LPSRCPAAPTCFEDLQEIKQNAFLLELHLAKKKKKKKKQNSETLNPQPVKSFSKPHYTEKIGGIQHCQTLALNLLGRCRPTGEQISRQTGLDARGVTPEQLRLKFYCS
jgi:hypothetical protein